MRTSRVIIAVPWVLVGLLAGGCETLEPSGQPGQGPPAPRRRRGDPGRLSRYERLQHEDPAVRIKAVLDAGRWKDAKALPYLVDRLTDSEAEVRFLAVLALRRITGVEHGYLYYKSALERAEAVGRWRAWLASRASGGSASRAAEGG